MGDSEMATSSLFSSLLTKFGSGKSKQSGLHMPVGFEWTQLVQLVTM